MYITLENRSTMYRDTNAKYAFVKTTRICNTFSNQTVNEKRSIQTKIQGERKKERKEHKRIFKNGG